MNDNFEITSLRKKGIKPGSLVIENRANFSVSIFSSTSPNSVPGKQMTVVNKKRGSDRIASFLLQGSCGPDYS